MNAKIFILALMVLPSLLAGCRIGNPVDLNRNLQRQLNDNVAGKPKDSNKSEERGGQPGVISINGIVVQNDGQLDPHIKFESTPGLGRDGTQAELESASLPVLSTNARGDFQNVQSLNTVLNIGCSDDMAQAYSHAKDSEKLEITHLSPNVNDFKLDAKAKIILLCGEGEDLKKFTTVSLMAEVMVMKQFRFASDRIGGSFKYSSSVLKLSGANLIRTKGVDLATTFSLTAAIELNVLTELSSIQDGTLFLQSLGSNYKTSKTSLTPHPSGKSTP